VSVDKIKKFIADQLKQIQAPAPEKRVDYDVQRLMTDNQVLARDIEALREKERTAKTQQEQDVERDKTISSVITARKNPATYKSLSQLSMQALREKARKAGATRGFKLKADVIDWLLDHDGKDPRTTTPSKIPVLKARPSRPPSRINFIEAFNAAEDEMGDDRQLRSSANSSSSAADAARARRAAISAPINAPATPSSPSGTDLSDFTDESPIKKNLKDSKDGRGKPENGMSNTEIDKIMNKYPDFLGTISHDEIPSKIVPQIKPKSKGGFIINTDPRSKPGQHWQAVYFDATPSGSAEIDFFDSYGDPADTQLLKDIKLIAQALKADNYLKFKENRIRLQNDKSSNCGWFCVKFLIDRFRGRPWVDASGFSDVVKGEANIEEFKHQHGGFRYIASFDDIHEGGNVVTGEFYSYYPPGVRKYLTDEPITSIKVGRMPISKGINTLLNVVTLGGWEKAKREVGYSDAFHLYLVINNKYRLERNHVIEMYPYRSNKDEELIDIPLGSKSGNLTLKEFLENTAKKVGPDLQRYDAAKNNCQIAAEQFLRSNGLLTASASSFIKQDIQKVISKLPWYAQWLAKKATDTAHLVDKTVHGNGKYFVDQ
jgi:hypothetical protein